ncbi:MAG: ABC transporter ATP-binding protein, partial [Niameybacter sp.]
MNCVELKGVYKSFKDKVALKHIDITVEQGEIFGLLGPNGAGKTTLINILGMVKRKDAGTVKVLGKTLEQAPMIIKRKMGVVPQELAIFEELTAYENVRFFGSLYGFKGEVLKEKVYNALKFVGLEERAKDKAKHFSGGMKRRLNIACGIVHEPELVIMDEPTVGIDPQSRNYILEAIKTLRRKGTTIIYTTHYMEEAEALCDRIAIIDRGDVIAIGTKETLAGMIEECAVLQVAVRDMSKISEEQLLRIKGVERIHFEGNTVSICSRREV